MKLGRLVDRRARPRRARRSARCGSLPSRQLPAPARRGQAARRQGQGRGREAARTRRDLLRRRGRPRGVAARGARRGDPARRRRHRPRAGARAAGVELRRAPPPEPPGDGRSQQVAAAVALRELGYKVTAKPEGALVVAVAPDAPAHGKIQPTDVIVGVDGKAGADAGRPAPADRDAQARRDGEAPRPPRRRHEGDRGRDDREPERRAGRSSGSRSSSPPTSSCPIDVDIDLAGVGGPSAGLAFALDIVEELRGNVDRGLKVAATGEIELDGSVLPIGGVKQKVIGARRSGADVFLVPAGDNAAEARRHAGDLRIIPVESFRQALRALATLKRKP